MKKHIDEVSVPTLANGILDEVQGLRVQFALIVAGLNEDGTSFFRVMGNGDAESTASLIELADGFEKEKSPLATRTTVEFDRT